MRGEAIPAGAPRRFQTTRWSLVLKAGSGEGREAASQLCEAYWAPVAALFCSLGAREHEVADLTQGFFASVQRDFATVDPARGRFRSWLCRCAKNHLYNLRDRENSLKAGGGRIRVSFDEPGVEDAELPEFGESCTPEQLFNRRWALTVIERALDRSRQYYARRGKLDLYQSLEGTLTGEGRELSDAELALALGKSEAAVRVERCTMKKQLQARLRGYLRAEVAETVPGPEEIDDEIQLLLSALA